MAHRRTLYNPQQHSTSLMDLKVTLSLTGTLTLNDYCPACLPAWQPVAVLGPARLLHVGERGLARF